MAGCSPPAAAAPSGRPGRWPPTGHVKSTKQEAAGGLGRRWRRGGLWASDGWTLPPAHLLPVVALWSLRNPDDCCRHRLCSSPTLLPMASAPVASPDGTSGQHIRL